MSCCFLMLTVQIFNISLSLFVFTVLDFHGSTLFCFLSHSLIPCIRFDN